MRGTGLALGVPSLVNETAQSAITKLASDSSTPTNALALAVLDALPQHSTADEAIKAGVPEAAARAFLPSQGVFPWMRLVAFGLDEGVFRDPTDTEWWSAPYALELYAPAGTWADIMAGRGDTHFGWDEQLATGDSSAIAQSLAMSAQEIEDVVEQEGCPKWIPNKVRGLLPTPNPKCWGPDIEKGKEALRDVVEKLHGGKPASSRSFLFWLAVGYFVIKGKL